MFEDKKVFNGIPSGINLMDVISKDKSIDIETLIGSKIKNNHDLSSEEIKWLKSRWGFFSGSLMYSLVMTEGKQSKPVSIDKDLEESALKVIKGLPKSKFSESTGLPDLRAINTALKMAGCKTINVAQRNFLAEKAVPSDELSTGAKSYAERIGIKKMTFFESGDFFKGKAVEWGKAQELAGIKAVEKRFDIEVKDTGTNQKFIVVVDGWAGHTPDGTIFYNHNKGRVEGKCPNSETHRKYLDIVDAKSLKEIEPKYYWQCQSYMMKKGIKFVLFFSFDPRFKSEDEDGINNAALVDEELKLHTVLIEPVHEDIQLLWDKTHAAIKHAKKFIEETRAKKENIDKTSSVLNALFSK